jgi:hypothetical protein
MVHLRQLSVTAAVVLAAALDMIAADPTFLHRYLPDVRPRQDDLTINAKGASYNTSRSSARAMLTPGNSRDRALRGTDGGPGGESAIVSYAAEEQIYYIVDGSGTLLYGDEKVTRDGQFVGRCRPAAGHGIQNSPRRDSCTDAEADACECG